MSIDPNPISHLDRPLADLEADMRALVARQRAQALEQQIAEISAHAHAAQPEPSGQLAEQWHQFLDIDPDLRGRDYSAPGGVS